MSDGTQAQAPENLGDDAAASAEAQGQHGDERGAAVSVLRMADWNWPINPRPAKNLPVLRRQVDEAFPKRSTASDGTIGDERHCGRNPQSSDHCPNVKDGDVGVVTAIDITHDPDNGCDMESVTAKLRDSRDPRIKYIIWNRRICNASAIGDAEPWEWRPYSGKNPHTKHAHISVIADKTSYDDESDWTIT